MCPLPACTVRSDAATHPLAACLSPPHCLLVCPPPHAAQICGVHSGSVYVLTNGGTTVTSVPIGTAASPGTPALVVSNLASATACAMDASGSGDLIVLNNNGADVLIVTQAQVPGFDASGATPHMTITVPSGWPLLAVAGNTRASPVVLFVSAPGSRWGMGHS